MFPERPRRPMPFYPYRQQRRAPRHRHGFPRDSSLFTNMWTPDGDWDFDKMIKTGRKAMDLYNQVSPYITRFIRR
ncbi:YppG family protein [Oceanobacillus sp. AG]|uniref:YppG family protein n=1 Tax=Oceanobacillus sp. AG TaxID=2681969 RepID=UPI0012EB6813